MDEFLTIAQLAQGFNVSEKVIRHAFKKLLKQQKLIEGEDYIREGYRDELHFVYKIHPGRFAVHSNLFPAPASVDNLATQFDTTATEVGSQSATHHPDSDSKVGSKPDDLGSNSATQRGSSDNRAVSDEGSSSARHESSRSEEYLEKFLASKDEQVGDLKEHLSDLRAQLAKKDEQLAQANTILTSMQEGQDMARDLIKMLGERVVDLSRRELPSGSRGNTLESNSATQHDELATHFATTPNHSATHDEHMGSTSATKHADEHISHP